jgi:hypothetical protein
MYRQAYTLFFTCGHRFTRRLISADSDKGNLSWRGFDALLIQKRKVDFPDNIENRLGFKRRTVQSMLNLFEKSRVKGLGIQTPKYLSLPVSNSHR